TTQTAPRITHTITRPLAMATMGPMGTKGTWATATMAHPTTTRTVHAMARTSPARRLARTTHRTPATTATMPTMMPMRTKGAWATATMAHPTTTRTVHAIARTSPARIGRTGTVITQ